ncbi:mycofactocin system FadH/OYE family oxidoreductase 1 [Rhodococcus sp. NPDC058521]|uniref:mycofactocin system FadH/OYE family oxidoreductase 1 n=1 Tax=Rhodococcus sp. NPDC058521 TaxID=3346536 RepID=UPI003650690F
MIARLTTAFTLAGRSAQSRVLFGPHETNLGEGRALSARHVAYYGRRARGGAGIVVTENASVHDSDHPYERAPLAALCEPGWGRVVDACRPHGTLALAGLTHHGAQGSTAYSRSALWGPSRVANVETREMPMMMARAEIDLLVEGFASSARRAIDVGMDGVELDAGPRSVLRQFHSSLTNVRTDAYGDDRLRLSREVLAAVRAAVGNDHVVSLRLSCDELAPWAGITPEEAEIHARELAPWLDLLVVVRGGPMSTSSYRPDFHEETGFNTTLCARIRETIPRGVAVALQGSVTEPTSAQAALGAGVADVVEMTRAQIADPNLVNAVRAAQSPRPCVRCNQACLVRHPRNPAVSCIVDPDTTLGFEMTWQETGTGPALVVGGGPAGLEAARGLALRGFDVTLAERLDTLGGMIRIAGVATPSLLPIVEHLEAECRRLGVTIRTGFEVTEQTIGELAPRGPVVVATGSRARPPSFPVDAGYVGSVEVLRGIGLRPGAVVVFDPVGGPAGTAMAGWLHRSGRDVSIVTPDPVVGRDLDRTGDLVGANVRAQRAGIRRYLDARITQLRDQELHLVDRFSGEQSTIPCAVLVDCSLRLPDLPELAPGSVRVGDCVAPRTVLEAIREGREAARATTSFDIESLTRQEN